jgi:hypothetical protein
VLDETDGPILRYGLQQMHGSRFFFPNPKNSGRTVMLLSGDSSVSR